MIVKRIGADSFIGNLTIFCFFSSGIVSMTDQLGKVRIPLLLLGAVFALINVIRKGTITLRSHTALFIWSLLCLFTGFISGVLLKDAELVADALAMFVVYLIFIGLNNEQPLLPNNIDGVMFTLFFAVTLISLVVAPLTLKNYSGFFYNVNALGGVYCCFFTYFIATLKENARTKDFKIALSLISFFLMTVSSSRGAFISGGLVFAIWALLELKAAGLLNAKRIVQAMLVVLFLFMLYYFTPLRKVVDDSIIAKFTSKSSDTTAGRMEIWKLAWQERSMWGHGKDYFSGYRLSPGNKTVRFGAHNTIVSILGQYGLVGAAAYIGFFAVICTTCIRKCRRKDYAPLLFAVSFFALSIVEGMMMKMNMFLMYFGVGQCLKNEWK